MVVVQCARAQQMSKRNIRLLKSDGMKIKKMMKERPVMHSNAVYLLNNARLSDKQRAELELMSAMSLCPRTSATTSSRPSFVLPRSMCLPAGSTTDATATISGQECVLHSGGVCPYEREQLEHPKYPVGLPSALSADERKAAIHSLWVFRSKEKTVIFIFMSALCRF